MPRAKPESSFACAARHLFRHINDVSALRDNPLVRSIVHAAREQTDEAILQAIHDAVTLAARPTGESVVPSPIHERRRQMVVALCAGEAPARTAARLGISVHHYYRERRAAAAFVAKALAGTPSASRERFEVTAPLKLLFTHAASLCDQGLAGTAVSMLEAALPCAANDTVRAALQSELARSLIALGRTEEAAQLLARLPVDELAKGGTTERWLEDHLTLTQAILAMERGDGAHGGKLLEMLARAKLREERPDEEALDAIIDCGSWYCQVGLFDKGRGMLDHARDYARRMDYVPARHQSAMALLAVYCAQQTCDEFDLEYHWLNQALAISTSNGSVRGMLQATAGLMQYYRSAGREDDAYRLAREGLRIAQGADGTLLLELFAVQTVGVLLRTRHWRAVDPLIFQIEELMSPGSMRWAHLKHFQGLFQMRAGRCEKAPELLLAAYEGSRRLNNPWLEGLALRDLATLRHRLGSAGEGAEIMRTALALLEGRATALSLRATYNAAARVLPDRRLARLAAQLNVSFDARAVRLDTQPIAAGDGIAVAKPLPLLTRRALKIGETQAAIRPRIISLQL